MNCFTMDLCVAKTTVVQQKVFRHKQNLRHAASLRRCGLFSFRPPYMHVVILALFSCHLSNATATGERAQKNDSLSAASTASGVFGRRDAIKKRTADLSRATVNFPGTCPVCNCDQQAFPSRKRSPIISAVTRYQQPSVDTSQAPSFSVVAIPERVSEAAAQSREPAVEDSPREAFDGASPRGGQSFLTLYGAALPASTEGGKREPKGELDSSSEEEEEDGDDDGREAGVHAEPEWFFPRRPGRGGGMRNLEKNFKQWMRKRLGKRYDSSTCKKLKRDGRHPSAALRHSPIEQFGYPVFDERSGRTFLERRLPLSIVEGYLVPIRVGAEDYVIQGTFDQVSSFLECFETYEAIASKLQPDGHWSTDAEHGPLFLQVQNTMQDLESPFTTGKLLFRWGFERLIRVIAGATSIKTFTDTNSYDEFMNLVDQVENVGDFLPHITRKELFDFWQQLVELPSISDRVTLLCVFLKRSFSRLPAADNPRWTDTAALNLRKPLTVTITSYTKPSHGLRSTYRMNSNVVTLGDVKEALSSLFENSTMAYALRGVSEAKGGQTQTRK